MVTIRDGQCGVCAHFGENNDDQQQLVQIRISHQAEPELVQACGHPDNMPRDLRVSVLSTCAGFEPAKVA
ncbi:MAG: hypothetical protein AAF432_09770 [Planctomycetota bacterium]